MHFYKSCICSYKITFRKLYSCPPIYFFNFFFVYIWFFLSNVLTHIALDSIYYNFFYI
jgi:hypothetical protein